MNGLHDRLRAAIDEKLDIARVAADLKPGGWIAYATHDGFEFTGASHVRTKQMAPDRTISSPVASHIADGLILTRTSFKADPPRPSQVAEHIAAHDPAWAIRQHEAALRVLQRHHPRELFDLDMVVCAGCGWDLNADGDGEPTDDCPDIRDLADAYGVPVDTEEGSRDA